MRVEQLGDVRRSDEVDAGPRRREEDLHYELWSRHAPDGSFRRLSANWPALVGWSYDELVGAHPRVIVHPDDRLRAAEVVEEVGRSGIPRTTTFRVRHRDGSHLWIESVVLADTDEATGEVRGLQLLSRDVSYRMAAAQAQRRRSDFAAVLLRLAVGFIDIGPEQVDAAIDEVLAEAGRFSGFQRAYLFRYDWRRATLTNSHEWCAPGITPMIAGLVDVPIEPVGRDAARRHRAGRELVVEDVRELPVDDPLRAHLEQQEIRGIATVPLGQGRDCLGFVGFDAVGPPRTLTSADRDLLRVVAALITNALRQRAQAAELEQHRSLLSMAGAVARFGGWMLEVGSGESVMSDELRVLLGATGTATPQLAQLVDRCVEPDRRELEAAIGRAAGEGSPWDLTVQVAGGGDGVRWLRTVGMAERDPHGAVARLWGAVQDVTEQHRVVEQVQQLAGQLAATMDSVNDGIVVLDQEGRVTYVNRVASALAGHAGVLVEELPGRRMSELMPDELGNVFHRAELRVRETQQPERLTGWLGPAGAWLDCHFVPTAQGMTIYYRDVTEQVEHARRLERTAEVERATAARLRQIDEAKSTFLTAVSHEIRTPLTVVAGLVETLVQHRGPASEPARRELEEALHGQTRRLVRLVEDLLDIDRLARGAVVAAQQPLDLVARTRALVEASDRRARMTLEAPDGLHGRVDPVQYDRILTNLLSNTDKYAPHGQVVVRLSSVTDGRVRLEVIDEGPGIDPGQLDRVFDPYVRLHADHPSPGTGAGLTLVRELARLHGGDAWAVDTGACGAHLAVELPS